MVYGQTAHNEAVEKTAAFENRISETCINRHFLSGENP
jgi:hypothetical protein